MESQPQNPEFRINPENFHPCTIIQPCTSSLQPDTPRYSQWTIPSLLYQTRRKNSIYKVLIQVVYTV